MLNIVSMLYKLKYYGVTDTAFDLVKNYLTNRKQYVVFDSCQSEHVEYILEYHKDPY